jgi:cytochrome P450
MNIKQTTTIPTVKGIPLLGIAPKMFGNNPMEYLKSVMLKHGDIVKLNLGFQKVFLVSSPELLQEVFRDKYSNYRKPDFVYDIAREGVGNGLVTSSGDFWLRQRRMIQPHLHRKQLGVLFTDMVDAIAEVLERTGNTFAQSGKEINLNQLFSDITMNVILQTMFGKGILTTTEIQEIGKCVTELVEYPVRGMFYKAIPEWIPVPERIRFKANLEKFQKVIVRVVAECRKHPEKSAGLIRMLMDAVDGETNEQMTEQQLIDETLTIFVAGYETTATTLTWLGVVIEQQPDILEKLQAEADHVLENSKPTFESIGKLTFARKVFHELLRMYTTVPLLFRAANETDMLAGYDIPKDSTIFTFFHGAHHNPRVWDNPSEFNPERFTPEEIAKRHQFAFIPFSGGQRKCAGDEFAMLEGQLIIAMMAQMFDITIVQNQSFDTRFGTTMRPKNGVRATLVKRIQKTY